MANEEYGQESYRSAYTRLAIEFVLLGICVNMAGFAAFMLLFYVLRDEALIAAIPLLPPLSLLATLFLMLRFRYIRIILAESEVIVRRPLGKDVRIPYADNAFSVVKDTVRYNYLPVATTARLVVTGRTFRGEVRLVNFMKSGADALFSALRRRVLKTEPAPVDAKDFCGTFELPREAMLDDMRKGIWAVPVVALLAAAVIAGGGVLAIGSGFGWRALGTTVAVCGALAVPLLSLQWAEYVWRKNRLPSRIVLSADGMAVDGEFHPWAGMRRIVVTPPFYRPENFARGRRMVVDAGLAVGRYYLGARTGGILYTTLYDDYAALCQALERAAAAKGFGLVYDL